MNRFHCSWKFWCICSIGIMILIFGFSAMNATQSSAISGAVTKVFEWFGFTTYVPDFETGSSEGNLRKCAHVFIYACLSFSVFQTFMRYNNERGKAMTILKTVGVIGICFIYACTDEFHQIFIEGRSGECLDVMIDGIGYISAALISYFGMAIKKGKFE